MGENAGSGHTWFRQPLLKCQMVIWGQQGPHDNSHIGHYAAITCVGHTLALTSEAVLASKTLAVMREQIIAISSILSEHAATKPDNGEAKPLPAKKGELKSESGLAHPRN